MTKTGKTPKAPAKATPIKDDQLDRVAGGATNPNPSWEWPKR